jgi:hypothetical protein
VLYVARTGQSSQDDHRQCAAGPHAAAKILKLALMDFPMNKSLHLISTQREVEFWQAVRQGRYKVARARAASICALPHHTGAIEMDIRCHSYAV